MREGEWSEAGSVVKYLFEILKMKVSIKTRGIATYPLFELPESAWLDSNGKCALCPRGSGYQGRRGMTEAFNHLRRVHWTTHKLVRQLEANIFVRIVNGIFRSFVDASVNGLIVHMLLLISAPMMIAITR